MKLVHVIAFLVVIAGGLNLLALGLIGGDLGNLFGGSDVLISRIIYVVIGMAAVYELVVHKSQCKTCSASSGASMDQGQSGM